MNTPDTGRFIRLIGWACLFAIAVGFGPLAFGYVIWTVIHSRRELS